ncbi:unnamed protein product, partial [Mesorhabditis spiculigera]
MDPKAPMINQKLEDFLQSSDMRVPCMECSEEERKKKIGGWRLTMLVEHIAIRHRESARQYFTHHCTYEGCKAKFALPVYACLHDHREFVVPTDLIDGFKKIAKSGTAQRDEHAYQDELYKLVIKSVLHSFVNKLEGSRTPPRVDDVDGSYSLRTPVYGEELPTRLSSYSRLSSTAHSSIIESPPHGYSSVPSRFSAQRNKDLKPERPSYTANNYRDVPAKLSTDSPLLSRQCKLPCRIEQVPGRTEKPWPYAGSEAAVKRYDGATTHQLSPTAFPRALAYAAAFAVG